MHSAEINLIRSSFAKVVPIADTAAGLFYDRLLELDEDLRPLFHSDLERQGRLLMQMISTAVDNLDDLEGLAPVVQKLGERRRVYGVEPGHYDTVGAALLWTLEPGLGEHYTPDVARAWCNAYGLLSGVMQGAAGYSHRSGAGACERDLLIETRDLLAVQNRQTSVCGGFDDTASSHNVVETVSTKKRLGTVAGLQ